MIWLIMIFGFFAAAQDDASGGERALVEQIVFAGGTFENRTQQNASISGLGDAKVSDRGKSALSLGYQADINFHPSISLSLLADLNQYVYSDGDRQDRFFLGVAPKLRRVVNDRLSFFTALGIGWAQNRLRDGETVSSGVRYRFNTTANTFAVSPRAGIEIRPPAAPIFFVIQVAYTYAKFEHGVTASSYPGGAAIGSGSVELETSHFTGYFGIGGAF